MRARARGPCAVSRSPPRGWRARPRSARAGESAARGARGRHWRRTGAAPGRSPRAVAGRVRRRAIRARATAPTSPASAMPDWTSSCCRVSCALAVVLSDLVAVHEPAGGCRVYERRRLLVDRIRDHDDRSVAIGHAADRGEVFRHRVVGLGNWETPCWRMHRAPSHCAMPARRGASSRRESEADEVAALTTVARRNRRTVRRLNTNPVALTNSA